MVGLQIALAVASIVITIFFGCVQWRDARRTSRPQDDAAKSPNKPPPAQPK